MRIRSLALLAIAGCQCGLFLACGGGATSSTNTSALNSSSSSVESSPAAPSNSEDVNNRAYAGTESDVRLAARKYLRQFLKYPENASFPWFDDEITFTEKSDGNTGYWLVRGRVEAMNAFGAKPTVPYIVRMSITRGENTYHLQTVVLDGEKLYVDPKSAAESQRLAAESEAQVATVIAARQAEDSRAAAERQAAAQRQQEQTRLDRIAALTTSEPRTWTSKDGQYTIDATFVTFINGKVRLQKADGGTVDVSKYSLTKIDQDYIDQQLANRKMADELSGRN